MHPSYEDRPGAADRSSRRSTTRSYEHQVGAWEPALVEAGAGDADVLHLHHLTPINEAAAARCPDVPVVGHLHGTELLMLEAIDDGPAALGARRGVGERMRALGGRLRAPGRALGVARCARAERLLGIDPARCVRVANGFDPDALPPQPGVDRAAHWRRHLVDAPRGWRPGASPGSVRYARGGPRRLRAGPTRCSSTSGASPTSSASGC